MPDKPTANKAKTEIAPYIRPNWAVALLFIFIA